MSTPMTISVSLADERDRQAIYAIRHQVYARELRQHPENAAGCLTDSLDAHNIYVVGRCAGRIAGFVSITPPNPLGYSFDKYFARDSLPFTIDRRLYEVRLLTLT